MIHKRKAFTLMELLIALSFVVIAAAIVSAAFLQGLRLFYAESERSDVLLNGSHFLDLMEQDLAPASAVTSAGSSAITFVKNGATITYTWDSGTKALRKTESGQTASILSGVENFTLSYDNPADVTRVSVSRVQ